MDNSRLQYFVGKKVSIVKTTNHPTDLHQPTVEGEIKGAWFDPIKGTPRFAVEETESGNVRVVPARKFRIFRAAPNSLNDREKLLCDRGEYIPAIKAHRARTGFGLKESKDIVDAYRGTNPGPVTENWCQASNEEKDLVRHNQYIQAIKSYRERTGATLAHAKSAIENWWASADWHFQDWRAERDMGHDVGQLPRFQGTR